MKTLLAISLCVCAFASAAVAAPLPATAADPAKPWQMARLDTVTPAPSAPAATDITSVVGGIPQSTSFTNAKIELFVGAVMQGSSSFNNSLEVRYNITPTIFASAQIQNSPQASVINAASLFVGLRKAWDTTEIWLKIGGGRDWQLGTWTGQAWAGIAYAPFQDSSSQFLNKVSTFLEQGIIVSGNVKQASTSTIGGVTYHL